MRVYYDPSVIIALYAPEPLTVIARKTVDDFASSLPLNDLQELEFKNGLRQKVLRQDISPGDLARCFRLFEDDCVEGKIQRKNVIWPKVFVTSEGISRRIATHRVCRAFDVLHVAIAAASGVDRFATFDSHQAAIAAAMKLKLVDFPNQ